MKQGETTSKGEAAQKRRELYEKQKELLKIFLDLHAITPEQYQKSLQDMTEKMGY